MLMTHAPQCPVAATLPKFPEIAHPIVKGLADGHARDLGTLPSLVSTQILWLS